MERMFGFQVVHYTLTAEPSEIRSFKLTIETKSPDELVSTCIPDLRRTSPTTLEVERRNFRPKDDLKFWFLPAAQLSANAPAPPAPAAPPLSSDSSCPIRATAITVGQCTPVRWSATAPSGAGARTTSASSAMGPPPSAPRPFRSPDSTTRSRLLPARDTPARSAASITRSFAGRERSRPGGPAPAALRGIDGSLRASAQAERGQQHGRCSRDCRRRLALDGGDDRRPGLFLGRSSGVPPARPIPPGGRKASGRKGGGGTEAKSRGRAPPASRPAQTSAVSGRETVLAASARTFTGSVRRPSTGSTLCGWKGRRTSIRSRLATVTCAGLTTAGRFTAGVRPSRWEATRGRQGPSRSGGA